MEQFMRPERFSTDSESDSESTGYRLSQILLLLFKQKNRIILLIGMHSWQTTYNVNEPTSECLIYEEAIEALDATYIKAKNDIFSRHLLATRRQEPGETLEHHQKPSDNQQRL